MADYIEVQCANCGKPRYVEGKQHRYEMKVHPHKRWFCGRSCGATFYHAERRNGAAAKA